MLTTKPISFLQALQENRIVHLCIDNQAYYPVRDVEDERFDAYMALCQNLADITNQAADKIQTVHINYRRTPETFAEYSAKPAFNKYATTIYYDKKNLKAYSDPKEETEKLGIDFINPQFLKHNVFLKDYCNSFEEGNLADFLVDNKKDVLLVSGCYLSACVKRTIRGARKKGYHNIFLLEDGVMDYLEEDCTVVNMADWQREKAREYADVLGVRTIDSRKLLETLKLVA